MAIEQRNLTEGIRLVARYKKQDYTCVVAVGDKGRLVYRLHDGRDFKSPSAAGMAITGKNCNGWVFWSLSDGSVTTPATPAPKQTQVEPKMEEAPEQEVVKVATATKCAIRKLTNQSSAPEGYKLWRCDTCKVSFKAPKGDTPTAH
jgi:hypothetical protein